LTPASYRTFLDRSAVGLVAVPVGVRLDFGSIREANLIAAGLPYLSEVWADRHWRLYAVDRPTAIVTAPAHIVSTSDTGLSLDVPGSGVYDVRLRWSPYLVITGGQVQRAADGDVTVTLDGRGVHRLHAVWRFP
jgi:hypothetical protein